MVHQMSATKAAKPQPRDYTVVKVMAALFLLILSVFALRKIGSVYTTLEGFDRIYPACGVVTVVALVLAAACIAVRVFVHQKVCRAAAVRLCRLNKITCQKPPRTPKGRCAAVVLSCMRFSDFARSHPDIHGSDSADAAWSPDRPCRYIPR